MTAIQFLGATGTVTGSKYLVEHGGRRVLVDCGLFQGYKPLRLRNWAPFPVDPASLDQVVLTHAHLDHTGYLPLLAKSGYTGTVYCTEATRQLCEILLPDSGHLQEEEALYANKRGYSKHSPALPLYTRDDAERCLGQLRPLPYDTDHTLAPGLTLRLLPAGHILGAAFVALQTERLSILFSGDLGRPHDLVMPPPTRIEQADYLIVESTYGNRRHDPADPLALLAHVINKTARRHGVVLIPTFAVGRAQTLLHAIASLKQRRAIPDIPVYLNSPMAVDATRIFIGHPDEHRLSHDECEALSRAAHIVNSVEESKRLNQKQGPVIILAASGMATGGRVVHHLRAFAADPRNTLLFAGFQAGGTRGASIVAGADMIKIHGEYVPVRAEVHQMENLSAHADADEILGWLGAYARPPRRTFITHGEPDAADALRRRIQEQLKWNCEIPDYLQRVALDD